MKATTLLTLLFLSLIVKAQDESLNIGDPMPDISFDKIVNYNLPSKSLNDFKGKVIIIDFWNTRCGSCIASMPKVAELQKKFRGKLQFFYATTEKKKDVEIFYSKNLELKTLGLPIITEADTLQKLFPHKGVPHVAWIGKDRKVKAISLGGYLTEINLTKLFERNYISLPVEKDKDFDYRQPLFINMPEAMQEIKFSSSLVNHIDGLPGALGAIDMKNSRLKIYAINVPLLALYTLAYRYDIRFASTNRYNSNVLLNVRDSSLFQLSKDPEEINKKTFCYELILPDSIYKNNHKKAFSYMQKDIDTYFDLESKVIKKNLDCYVITEIHDNKINNVDSAYMDEHINYVELKNQPPSVLEQTLYTCYDVSFPFVYEGSSDRKISILIDKHTNNIGKLKKDLNDHGLDIVKAKRIVTVLEIADKK